MNKYSARTLSYDEREVLLPLHWSDLYLLHRLLELHTEAMQASGDYPEDRKDRALLAHIKAAMSIPTRIE